MAEDTNEPEDVASLMRALWGPRANAQDDDPAPSPAEEAKEPPPAPTTPETAAVAPAGRAFDGFKAYLDAAFAEQLTSLRSYVDAALADGLLQVRTEALAAVEAQVSAALANQLAAVRTASMATADARVAGAEARLLGRLEGIAAGITEMVERNSVTATALAGLQTIAKETADRLTALEQLAQPELLRLGSAVEDLRQGSVTASSNLAALRSEALEAAEARIAASSGDLQEQLDAALDRVSSIEEKVSLELVRVSESVAAIRTELAGSVVDLETALGRWAAEWRDDVDARLDGVVRDISPVSGEAGRRRRKRKVRRDEMQRLVESVTAWRAQSVSLHELVAVRRELEAEVERRFAVLDTVRLEVDRSTDPLTG